MGNAFLWAKQRHEVNHLKDQLKNKYDKRALLFAFTAGTLFGIGCMFISLYFGQ